MTPVGPDPHAAPRPPPGERPALPLLGGAVPRARAARRSAPRPYPRLRAAAPLPRRAAAPVGRHAPPAARRRTARAARRLRRHRRAARRGAGARRRGVRRLRRVAALPGHHPAGRPRLDLRPQRQRPRGQPPAADDLGEPVADRAPARGGDRARRSARRSTPRATHRAGREAGAATPSSPTSPAGSTTRWPPRSRRSTCPGIVVPRGAEALRAGRRPGPLGARPGRRRQRRPLRPRAAVRRRAHRRARRAVIEKDPDGRTIPGGEHQRVPAAARRRPRAHDRPLDAVRDRARPRRPDPRQGRQGRHRDRRRARRPARSSRWPTSPPTPRPARSSPPATTWARPRSTSPAR